MNLCEFNNIVLGINGRNERLRLALIGDALIQLYGIEVGLTRWPDKPVGFICDKIQPLQANNYFISYMTLSGIRIPKELSGKSIADYFEAWVGYLHVHCGASLAKSFCVKYFKSQINLMENSKGFSDFTKEFLDQDDLETEELEV